MKNIYKKRFNHVTKRWRYCTCIIIVKYCAFVCDVMFKLKTALTSTV